MSDHISEHSKTGHCCVIGGGGFIGHHLVPLLLSSGRRVTVVGRRAAPTRFLPAGVRYIAHDYGDRPFLAELLKDVDEVVNLAYSSVPKTSFEDPVQDILSNLPAAVSLFLATSRSSVQRLILVSSGGTVYGKAESLPIGESHPTNPVSPYGITKLAIEKYAIMYHNHTELPVVVLRPGNAFGEGQRPFSGQGFIATAISSILSGKEITIYGRDGMIRDYIYVGDVAGAIMAALERGRPGRCYNVGTGIGRNNREVLDAVLPHASASGFKLSTRMLQPREFDVPANVLSPLRFIEDTGWQTTTSFEDAIERTWKHLRENGVHADGASARGVFP
jgi:UDP-glucose 4-epimerase